MKVHEQITFETWTKKATARDAQGIACAVINGRSFCAWGWLLKVYGLEESFEVEPKLLSIIKEESLLRWNDDGETNFEKVKEAFKLADL